MSRRLSNTNISTLWGTLVAAALTSSAAQAIPELYSAECGDTFDNDGDGLVDCAEEACRSSYEDSMGNRCTDFPAGPHAVGIAEEAPLVQFDAPGASEETTTAHRFVVGDLDAFGPNSDSVVVLRTGALSLFRGVPTPGFMSLPKTATLTITNASITNNAIAIGDTSGDGLPDLVVSVATGLQRYRGNSSSFVLDGSVIAAPASTQVAVADRSIVTVNTRIRIYDSRCTAAPAGFPAGEVFGQNGLCASIAAPANLLAEPRILSTANSRYLLLATVANGTSTLRAYELTRAGGVFNVVVSGTELGPNLWTPRTGESQCPQCPSPSHGVPAIAAVNTVLNLKPERFDMF
jgi:hypothetical protein